MAPGRIRDETIARLRANLAAAGVAVGEEALARIDGGPFLRNVEAFARLVARVPAEMVPDTLKDWRPDAPVAPGTERAGEGAGATGELVDPLDPFAPLHEVAAAIDRREVSPVALAEATLARIAARDPALNAFQLVLADEARAAAAEAEREIAAGRYRGPFHGVPVAVKDLLTMRGTVTTAGSRVLADWAPDEDATAVRLLREAGATIVGKTRLSEFAYSPASNNAHYGPTHNPWQPGRDAGGSSSGSAAAVAAGLAHAALGSDTGGSIRMPATLCGLVGLKPTYGLVSLAGAVSLSWSLDHLGPLTRTVRDAALLLEVLAGHDPRDPRTRPGSVPDYTAGLEDGVRGLRIGAVREDGAAGPPDAAALAAWEDGLRALRDAGAEIVDLDLPELEELRVCGAAIIVLEAAAFHERTLRERPHDLGPFPRDRITVAYAYGPTAPVQAQGARAWLRARLDRLWERVDLLSTPAMAHGAPPLGEIGQNTRYTLPFNVLGWPAIVVPTGLTGDGLPLGAQLVGRPWDDVAVLRAARVVERDGPWRGRRPPE
jgi:aspartyl-tRNA(Asn)/glutamyl-tRNA(Gln) amidotransferase subunit A